MINKFKKIVIKIGSSSIIDEKTRKIKLKWLYSICKDIEVLYNENTISVDTARTIYGKKAFVKFESVDKARDLATKIGML